MVILILEHDVQDQIRLHVSQQHLATIFRGNVGQGWTGSKVIHEAGQVIIKNPRPFNTGLPKGFPDLFGIKPIIITPDMVGKTIGVFCAIEVKHKGKITTAQQNFIEFMRRVGALAGIAKSVEDAERILRL